MPFQMSTISSRRVYKNTAIHVVIPAYNEGRFIGRVLSTLPGYVDKIIVVDDCSTDDTFRIAVASVDPRVMVIKTAHNCGIGQAMRLGYQKALNLGGEVLVKMDGDDQM